MHRLRPAKIINDPVYGFISIPQGLIFDIITHPWMQRLGRIKQLGLTHYVYPGATHTRFHHALGAFHLMQQALENLRQKGHDITAEEQEAAGAAILLHDIGHGPFSHTLEKTIIHGINHEQISLLLMEKLNDQFNSRLSMAIRIFKGEYPKTFLHKLISGQLDVDRLDYLNRDSFYTGVSEGVIGYDRIIKMLDVNNGQLVVEEKGIYSIEKFLIARRLMYWQVYLHKTVLSAEQMLVRTLIRAQELAHAGEELFASPALAYFLSQKREMADFADGDGIKQFMCLDDYDIFSALKVWCTHPDKVLQELSGRLVDRRLLKVKLQEKEFDAGVISAMRDQIAADLDISPHDAAYLLFTDSTSNHAYNPRFDSIQILDKEGNIKGLSELSTVFHRTPLSEPVVKHYLCYPRSVRALIR